MLTCPRCGDLWPPDGKYCAECGCALLLTAHDWKVVRQAHLIAAFEVTVRTLFADAYPRRVAHAVHALMEVRNDVNIGPYGPFKASEVVLYDSEALSVGATYQALRRGMKYGLTVYVGHGLWTAGDLALDHVRDFEERYLRDTADA